jgi:hypothetical protein
VLALQQTAGNQAVARALGRAPAPAAAVNPVPAFKAMDAWRVKADELLAGTTAFETANWIDFLGRTSSNPSLSLADTQLASVMSNAVGNLLTEGGAEAIEKGAKLSASALGALIGTGLEPGLGTVIGFFIGVFIESAASYLFETITGAHDPGETAADAAKRVTAFIQQQHKLLSEQHRLAAAELEAFVAAIKDRAEQASDQGEVDKITAWGVDAAARTGAPPKLGPPYPLSFELLKIWTLEHAGDLSSAHAGTDAAQLASGVADVFGEDGLKGQPSLFVYQTRAEWQRAGLAHADQSAPLLVDVDALVSETGSSTDIGAIGAADAVQAAYQGREFAFSSIRDADALRWYIVTHNNWTSVDKDWLLEKIQAGGVRAFCGLDVHSADESVYIDEWNWRFEIDLEPGENPNPGPGGVGDVPDQDTGGAPDVLNIAFDVWPTWG